MYLGQSSHCCFAVHKKLLDHIAPHWSELLDVIGLTGSISTTRPKKGLRGYTSGSRPVGKPRPTRTHTLTPRTRALWTSLFPVSWQLWTSEWIRPRSALFTRCSKRSLSPRNSSRGYKTIQTRASEMIFAKQLLRVQLSRCSIAPTLICTQNGTSPPIPKAMERTLDT